MNSVLSESSRQNLWLYTFFINGKSLNYEPINDQSNDRISDHNYFMENITGRKHLVMISPYHSSLRSFEPVTVPDENYFMMGDNRDNSADSRYFGFVERNQIVGQATTIVVSFDKNKKYRPRWTHFYDNIGE